MLQRQRKIATELIEKLMGWRYSGVSVHAENRPAGDDRKKQQVLIPLHTERYFCEAKYGARGRNGEMGIFFYL
jgi:hypothetical protein